jgi:hypothetical protein
MNPKRPPVRHRGRAAHLRLLQAGVVACGLAAGLVEFLALQRRRLAGRPQRDADAMRN